MQRWDWALICLFFPNINSRSCEHETHVFFFPLPSSLRMILLLIRTDSLMTGDQLLTVGTWGIVVLAGYWPAHRPHWRAHMVRVVDQAVTQTLKWPKLRQKYAMERVLSISQTLLLQSMNQVPHQVILSIYSWAYYCWWFLLQLWCKTSVQSFRSLSLYLEVILPHWF